MGVVAVQVCNPSTREEGAGQDDRELEARLGLMRPCYKTKETLLDAIRHISYKGGNTKTGKNQTDIDKTMPSESSW